MKTLSRVKGKGTRQRRPLSHQLYSIPHVQQRDVIAVPPAAGTFPLRGISTINNSEMWEKKDKNAILIKNFLVK